MDLVPWALDPKTLLRWTRWTAGGGNVSHARAGSLHICQQSEPDAKTDDIGASYIRRLRSTPLGPSWPGIFLANDREALRAGRTCCMEAGTERPPRRVTIDLRTRWRPRPRAKVGTECAPKTINERPQSARNSMTMGSGASKLGTDAAKIPDLPSAPHGTWETGNMADDDATLRNTEGLFPSEGAGAPTHMDRYPT